MTNSISKRVPEIPTNVLGLGMLLLIFMSSCTPDIPTLVEPLPAFSKADSTIHREMLAIHWSIQNKENVPIVSLRTNVLLPKDQESDSTLFVENMWSSPEYFVPRCGISLESKSKGPFLSGENTYSVVLDIEYRFLVDEIPLHLAKQKSLVDYDTIVFIGDNDRLAGSDFQVRFEDPLWNSKAPLTAHLQVHPTFEIRRVEGKWEVRKEPILPESVDGYKWVIAESLGEGWANPDDFSLSFTASVEDVAGESELE